ncbi:MAG: lysophospholipid acyltransferase family protein [Pseudomonadota bacterium]
MHGPSRGTTYRLLDRLNRLICRVLYQVTPLSPSPLPQSGPVLLVSDHSSYSDPMVLAATANRPIIFLTAREVYQRRDLRWLCETAHYIPINRDTHDVGAVRAMLRALRQGEVVGIFPEGGIDEHREESGHLGIGYLALKTGAPVVPVSIAWDQARPVHLGRSLLTPGRAVVRYGPLIVSQFDPDPTRETIHAVTATIMRAIQDIRTGKA